MSYIQVPPVTQADLLKFQTDHFFGASISSITPTGHHGKGAAAAVVEEELYEEAYYEDDDGLGYYEDGVKRTLTDEQIKIFRHSEIHALLRERQRLREEQEEEDEVDEEVDHGADRRSDEEKLHAGASDFLIDSSSSHRDSIDLAATQKRKSTESDESRGVNADKKRLRDGIYADDHSNISPVNDDNEAAIINVQENPSSRDLNSVRRIVSYAED